LISEQQSVAQKQEQIEDLQKQGFWPSLKKLENSKSKDADLNIKHRVSAVKNLISLILNQRDIRKQKRQIRKQYKTIKMQQIGRKQSGGGSVNSEAFMSSVAKEVVKTNMYFSDNSSSEEDEMGMQ